MRGWRRRDKAAKKRRCAGRQGFTLVEILVTLAIMSVLLGMMLPLIDKVWLGNEVTETRQKMADLKRAMVGDPRMVQNGIRMHYGFVGDYGVPPEVIADLVIEPTWVAPGAWNGPYLTGAFDMKDYYNDAWHRQLIYTVYPPNDPLRVTYAVEGHPDVQMEFAATLTSLGPDGLPDTADDINVHTNPELQILKSEVWPTSRAEGNMNFVFNVNSNKLADYALYTRLSADYKVPGGTATALSSCFKLSIGAITAPETRTFPFPFPPNPSIGGLTDPGTSQSVSLPVGQVKVMNWLYSDESCQNPVAPGNEMAVYISEGMSTLTVSLPTLKYDVP